MALELHSWTSLGYQTHYSGILPSLLTLKLLKWVLCWRSTMLDHTSWKQASLPKSTFHKVMSVLKSWNTNSMEIIKCHRSQLALLLVQLIKYSQRPLTHLQDFNSDFRMCGGCQISKMESLLSAIHSQTDGPCCLPT